MTLLNLMERVGSRNTKLIAAYVNDALSEIGFTAKEKVEETKMNIQSGVYIYSLPANRGKVDGIYYLDDDGYYKKMSRINELDKIKASAVSGSTVDSSGIVGVDDIAGV